MTYEQEQLAMIEAVTSFITSEDDIDVLLNMLKDGRQDTSQLADLLEYMGLIDIPLYLDERTEIIRAGLHSKATWVRHGALQGASYLDKRTLLPDVKQLLETEESEMMRKYAEAIIFYWEREVIDN